MIYILLLKSLIQELLWVLVPLLGLGLNIAYYLGISVHIAFVYARFMKTVKWCSINVNKLTNGEIHNYKIVWQNLFVKILQAIVIWINVSTVPTLTSFSVNLLLYCMIIVLVKYSVVFGLEQIDLHFKLYLLQKMILLTSWIQNSQYWSLIPILPSSSRHLL